MYSYLLAARPQRVCWKRVRAYYGRVATSCGLVIHGFTRISRALLTRPRYWRCLLLFPPAQVAARTSRLAPRSHCVARPARHPENRYSHRRMRSLQLLPSPTGYAPPREWRCPRRRSRLLTSILSTRAIPIHSSACGQSLHHHAHLDPRGPSLSVRVRDDC